MGGRYLEHLGALCRTLETSPCPCLGVPERSGDRARCAAASPEGRAHGAEQLPVPAVLRPVLWFLHPLGHLPTAGASGPSLLSRKAQRQASGLGGPLWTFRRGGFGEILPGSTRGQMSAGAWVRALAPSLRLCEPHLTHLQNKEFELNPKFPTRGRRPGDAVEVPLGGLCVALGVPAASAEACTQ